MTAFDHLNTARNIVPAAPDAPQTPAQKRARQSAEDFEAMFISQMLSQMKMGVDPDSAFGGGRGEEAFQSVLNDKYGEAVSQMGGIGIADAIYKEILKLQEGTE